MQVNVPFLEHSKVRCFYRKWSLGYIVVWVISFSPFQSDVYTVRPDKRKSRFQRGMSRYFYFSYP